MKKYRDTLIHNIHKQLEAWFDQTGPIPHEELYRFLHSLKGTAGTIGLQDLADVAQVLLNQLENLPPKDWKSTECQQFILTRSSFLTTKSMNRKTRTITSTAAPQALDGPYLIFGRADRCL